MVDVGNNKFQSYVYIYHMGLKFNLPVLPDSINDSLPISFNQEPILARSAPQITFSNAGPRTLGITLKLHRHLFCLENADVEHYRDVNNILMARVPAGDGQIVSAPATDVLDIFINAMLTLSLPKYTDTTKVLVPPSILIRFGEESCIRGVPSNISKTASGVWLKNGKLSEISLTFTITEVEPFSAQYVAKNGTLRSISTDLQRGSVWQY